VNGNTVLFWGLALGYAIYVAGDMKEIHDRREARELEAATTRTENSKCALRGLVLLRGQLGEFVCVVPGSERGRRKP
jgi:hypothetical protein